MESMLYQPERSLFPTNLNISKEVTITPIINTENSVVSKLKKLPDITFDLIQSEPVFKVPVSPISNIKSSKKITNCVNKSKKQAKNIFEKKISSRRQENHIVNRTIPKINASKPLTNLNSNFKTVQKQKTQAVNNILSKQSNNVNKVISKNLKSFSNKNSSSEKENVQNQCTPIELTDKLQNDSKLKVKNEKNVQMTTASTNTSIVSQKVNTTSNDNLTIDKNNEIKTIKSADDDYILMDISSESEIKFVSASCPSDFDTVSVPEYDNFVLGIGKLFKDGETQFKTSQNYDEEVSHTEQYFPHFSNFFNDINTSLSINESNDMQFNSTLQSFSDDKIGTKRKLDDQKEILKKLKIDNENDQF